MVPSARIPADRVEAAAKAAHGWVPKNASVVLARAVLAASGYEADLAARDQRIKELEHNEAELRAQLMTWKNDGMEHAAREFAAEARVRVLEAENERLKARVMDPEWIAAALSGKEGKG